MEVTVLVQATDQAFEILEKARNEARELLYSSAKLTSETKSLEERRRARAFLSGAQASRIGLRNFIISFFVLFAFWVLLSGRFDLFNLVLGYIYLEFLPNRPSQHLPIYL